MQLPATDPRILLQPGTRNKTPKGLRDPRQSPCQESGHHEQLGGLYVGTYLSAIPYVERLQKCCRNEDRADRGASIRLIVEHQYYQRLVATRRRVTYPDVTS